MDLLDGLLLLAAVLFAVSGYRQGFVVGILSFVGFLGGGVLGAQLARPLTSAFGAGDHAPLAALIVVLLFACVGQLVATTAGAWVRRRLTWQPVRAVDNVFGAVVSVISLLLVAWLLGTAADRSPFTGLAREVRGSQVLTTVDGLVPTATRDWFSSFRQLVDQNGFPQVFGDLAGGDTVSVSTPDPAAVRSAGVVAAAASIVKIRGIAPSCSKAVEGSGFVFAPQRIMTNAHVVAGVTAPRVEVGGRRLAARVVLFDPDDDVAVLYVPGLTLRPLSFTTAAASSGTSVVVAGYPEDGPYTTGAGRIRTRQSATAPNIYSRGTVRRDIYALRAVVRPGNSGGPLLSVNGTVDGVVFAAATDDADTGYALTAAQVADDAAAGRVAGAAVSTQGCD